MTGMLPQLTRTGMLPLLTWTGMLPKLTLTGMLPQLTWTGMLHPETPVGAPLTKSYFYGMCYDCKIKKYIHIILFFYKHS